MDNVSKKRKRRNPREDASSISVWTFSYLIPVLIRYSEKELNEEDLTETFSEHESKKLGDLLEEAWILESKEAEMKSRSPSLLRVLFRVFGIDYMKYGFIYVLPELLKIVQPIAVGRVIRYFSPNKNETKGEAFMYGTLLVAVSCFSVLITHPYLMTVVHLGMKLRIACCSLIYRKSLKLSQKSLGETTIGQIVNLMSNDVNKLDNALLFAHHLWIAPLQVIIISIYLYWLVGYPAFSGMLILILMIPLQVSISKKISAFRMETAQKTDERINLMSEIINGIQVIKMYAWEKSFANLVDEVRRNEIKKLKSTGYLRAVMYCFMVFNTRLAIFASLITFYFSGSAITTERVFVLVSFYNSLKIPITVYLPNGIMLVAEAFASVKRLNSFLGHTEKEPKTAKMAVTNQTNDKKMQVIHGKYERKKIDDDITNLNIAKKGIYMTNVSAKWNDQSKDNTLSRITVSVTEGNILGIIGTVGSGKSSLLQVILKELPRHQGSLVVNGAISYASQEPWLFSGSIRQNILFGSPLDKTRYDTVLEICALNRDLDLLPSGDMNLVGDRGITLSGGQKARINLARAVYKKADIYLLDDPLSAVDTLVGKELFGKCITTFLKDKTVLLVTHQLQHLNEVKKVIYLEDGSIKAEGTFQELKAMNLDFAELFGENGQKKGDEMPNMLQRTKSTRSRKSLTDGRTLPREQMSKGTVNFSIFLDYLQGVENWCLVSAVILLFFFVQVSATLTDYLISVWANLEDNNYLMYKVNNQTEAHNPVLSIQQTDGSSTFSSKDLCVLTYSIMVILLVMFTVLRSFTFFHACMLSSTKLHDNMFQSISKATMNFFNDNPAGRILNRFSKDVGAIDELFPCTMIDFIQVATQILGVLIIICSISYIFLVPVGGLVVLMYLFRRLYLQSSTNIKRLEGVTRSPVFSHIASTLNGLTTIRALEAQELLIEEFDSHQDVHSCVWYNFIAFSRAFGYWLDWISVIFIAIVTFTFLFFDIGELGGNVGLVLTQAILITASLQWGIRQSTEFENQMTSLERMIEYQRLEHERSMKSTEKNEPRRTWPENGKLDFREVSIRYSKDGNEVLRNLSFTINPKEKIGIVGRTGAGKSSIINALFQMCPTEGKIVIDDIDITQIGLHDLRSKIAIIPQEPVLFSGTLAKNLDPFGEYQDSDLWKALEDVELKSTMNDLTGGLETKISERGSNFSVGQRQLVCLARAILRKNKILVLDEATANVDHQTDALIQTTIRQKFAECTVLTIAHRLHTVMDSDKVLVMDSGTVREFDHPFILLQNKEGMFYKMVEETGKATAEILHEVSKNHYYVMTEE